MQKMNANEPLMRYRNTQDDVKTGFLHLARDKPKGNLLTALAIGGVGLGLSAKSYGNVLGSNAKVRVGIKGLIAIRMDRIFEEPSSQPDLFLDAKGNPAEVKVMKE